MADITDAAPDAVGNIAGAEGVTGPFEIDSKRLSSKRSGRYADAEVRNDAFQPNLVTPPTDSASNSRAVTPQRKPSPKPKTTKAIAITGPGYQADLSPIKQEASEDSKLINTQSSLNNLMGNDQLSTGNHPMQTPQTPLTPPLHLNQFSLTQKPSSLANRDQIGSNQAGVDHLDPDLNAFMSNLDSDIQ